MKNLYLFVGVVNGRQEIHFKNSWLNADLRHSSNNQIYFLLMLERRCYSYFVNLPEDVQNLNCQASWMLNQFEGLKLNKNL